MILLKKKNKQYFGVILTAVFLASCFGMCGCGGTVSERNMSEAEKEVVSGRAVSGTAVEKSGQMKKKRTCCTDTNLYIEAWKVKKRSDDKDSEYSGTAVRGLMQTRLDGSCRREIELGENFFSMVGVAGSWLYYTTDEGKSEDDYIYYIYRVPIRKGADGYDEVDAEKAEKIIGSETDAAYSCTEIYVDETYLLYVRNCEYEETVVVYDLKKGEEVDFGGKNQEVDIVQQIGRLGNQYAVLTESFLFVMPPDASGWNDVLNGGYIKEYNQVLGERFLFYDCFPTEEDECEYSPGPDDMDKDIIRACDGKEDRGLVTRKELKKAVEDAAQSVEHMTAGELEEWEIEDLLCDGDRCYIEVQMTGTHDGVYHTGYLIFSKAVGDKKVRLEKELMQSMRQNEKKWEGRWCITKKKQKKVIKEKSVINPVYCDNIVNGKAYFYCHDEQNERHLMCYDLHAGSVVEITKQSPLYFERFDNYTNEERILSELWLEDEELGFGYADPEDVADMPILPHEDAYFEEVSPDEKKK